MIRHVSLQYFKRFSGQEFELYEHVVLAGPNNSGKSTLLQAISAWNLALQRWLAERGPETGSTAKQRTGVPITRKDFTAIPLRELSLLWTEGITALRQDELQPAQKPGYPRLLTITLQSQTAEQAWDLAFEFRYQSSELLYVKPSAQHMDNIAKAARSFKVVHVPAFSGIGAEETRYDRPYQDLLIGQGKPGDILRNLLLEVYQQDNKSNWAELTKQVEGTFGYKLQPPLYEGRPYILCEYLQPASSGEKSRSTKLDVASAGSGFHQVLLLLGFFYARPASVLLLDEPDAHLHVILQKEIYDLLRRIAAKRACQLIIATHSEVLIDGTDPSLILSFYRDPHRLVTDLEREQVREALKRLQSLDILLAEQGGGVLYLESESDFNLLRAWAGVLGHRTHEWFSRRPFWHNNQGRHPREARDHFFALRAVNPDVKGVLVLDGDNRNLPGREVSTEGLAILRWTRYEAESYLIHPQSLQRYLESVAGGPLFVPQFAPALDYLREQLPPAIFRDPLGIHDYLNVTAASKVLLPEFFKRAGLQLPKSDYYLVAEQMKPEEVTDEVRAKLDAIAEALQLSPSGTGR